MCEIGLVYPSSYVSGSGSPAGVSTINGLTGNINLSAGSGISITPSGNTLIIASTATGTVTSVGLTVPSFLDVTPASITSSGTFAVTLLDQPSNYVFAGPVAGPTGAVTFRPLVEADIPTLSGYLLTDGSNSPMTGELLLNPAFQISTNGAITLGQATSLLATNLSWKTGIVAATLTRLQGGAGPTYYNGPSNDGVGATLTRVGNGPLPAIDGISVQVGDRIGVFHETAQLKIGIYDVIDLGSAGTPWILMRSPDADSSAALDKAAVAPTQGSQAGHIFQQSTASPVVGTDPIVFSDILSSIIQADEVTLTLNAGIMSIKAGGITNTHVAAAAGINFSKLELTNPNSIAFFDGTGALNSRTGGPDLLMCTDSFGAPSLLAVTTTEGSYLMGATSNIQIQINGKEPAITAGVSSQYWRGDKTFQALDTSAVPENGSLYFTNARARLAISAAAPVIYNSVSGSISMSVADTATDGYLTSVDWNIFNGKLSDPLTTNGDLLYRSGGVTTRLPVGSNGQILGVVGGAPTWATINGILTLNTLNAGAQTLAVGTSGTDFAIVSAVATHTFNLPTVSGTARGAVTSALFNTWNAKEPAITAGTTAQYYRGDKSFQTLDTSVVPENTNLYYTAGRFTTSFATKSTTDLAEGTNLYFTNARARLAISATTPVAYNSGTGVISMAASTNSVDGYLTAVDHTLFAAKLTSPMTTNGDIITQAGGVAARLAIGAANTVLTSNGTSASWLAPAAVSLTTGVTGILPLANGGTNASSLAAGLVISTGTALSTKTYITLRQTATQTNTTVTYADVTNLTTVSLAAGNYKFKAVIIFQTAATTTGIGLRVAPALVSGATVSLCYGKWQIAQAANGTAKDFVNDQILAASNFTSASVVAATTDNIAIGDGTFTITGAGIMALQLRSEIAASGASVMTGSFLEIEQI